MANELAVLIENRLAKKGWSVTDLVRETGLTAGTVAELLGPRELPGMPDGDTVERLATALGIPPRRVVLRAVEACGMATSWAGDHAACPGLAEAHSGGGKPVHKGTSD